MNGSGVISQLKEAEFRLDRVCRQFEQAWRLNRPLTIEQCLSEVESVERAHLLEELIASEWELRVRRGEDPEPAEYLARFPHEPELVAAICGVLAAEYAAATARGGTTTPQPGDHLGDYKIIREVGRGGMGIVYEARQESLGRQVALKVLPARRFRSERELHRFRREAQAVARLHHSHIVEIYGVGEQDGIHYFAMRYVTGRGIDQVIAELQDRLGLKEDDPEMSVLHEPLAGGRASLSSIHTGSSLLLSRACSSSPDSIDSLTPGARYRAAARIGFQAAEALQYAHERGIQHRDVKPSNLLIDRHEVVWLTDFGLAKLDLDANDITESDDLIGTLKYMPPEALTGKVDHRSDIYSLGLTLYELVTLRSALDGSDRAQLLEQVKDPLIPAPRWLVPDLPRDLETIILKSMARDLDQRYQSASDLAADLERFLNHEPIRARPQSTFTKFRRWVERKPLMAFLALGTLSITSTSVFSFGAVYLNALATAKQARKDRDLANNLLVIAQQATLSSESSRRAAEISTREAHNRLIQAQRSEAASHLQQGDDFASLVWTAETLRSASRLVAPSNGRPEQSRPQFKTGRNHLDASGHLALEPALRLRLGAIIQNSPRIVLREWLPTAAPGLSVSGGSPSALLDSRGDKPRMWFSRDGRRLCIANVQHTRLHRWNLETGAQEQLTTTGPDGECVFTDSGTGRVFLGGNQSLQYCPLDSVAEHPRDLEAPHLAEGAQLQAAWESPDGRWLLVGFGTTAGPMQAWLWNLTSGRLANPLPLPVAANRPQVEYSRNGERLFVRSEHQVRVLDLPSWKSLLPDESFEAGSAGWSRDGRWFAAFADGQTRVWRLDALLGQAPQVFDSPALKEIAWHDNGGWLAMLLPRGRVAFYTVRDNQTVTFQDSVHPSEIDAQGFSFSPDGQWYALGHEDGNVRVWNIHNHQPWTGILRHPGAVRSLCWSPGGDLLATSTPGGLVTVWGLTPSATGQLFFHPDAVRFTNVRFSSNGSRVVAADELGAVVAWNLETGGIDADSHGPEVEVTAPTKPDAIHPGKEAGEDRPRAFLHPDTIQPLKIEFSSMTEDVAIVGADGAVHLFQDQSGTVAFRLRLPQGYRVAALTFSPSGTRLAIAGNLGLQVWDTRSGKLLTASDDTEAVPLRRVCFSSDGTHLATVSENHVCQIRDATNWSWHGGGFQLESRPVLAEFNPRDNTFVTATEAGVVQIWDWSRGEPLIPPLRHALPLTAAHLSADGRQIAVVSGDSLCVWKLPEPNSLPPEKVAAWARDVALTDVNTADGTLTPLSPGMFPDQSAEAARQRASLSPLDRDLRCRWHLYQANSAHLHRDISVEEFHIRCLRDLNPLHEQLTVLERRLNRVRKP